MTLQRSPCALGARWLALLTTAILLACEEPPIETALTSLHGQDRLGELSLPLTVTRGGDTYRLSATFVLRRGPEPDGPVVRTLSTGVDPDAMSVRTTLDPGRYYVFLEPGWSLERITGDRRAPVEARLLSDNPSAVDVTAGERTRLDLRLALDEPPAGDGELVIGLDVVGCGNGTVEPGEHCDDGPRNGAPGRCDASCAFACTGSCPLRVRPGAEGRETGRSWTEAMGDLQAAINHQRALGGGEVWVIGGSHPTLDSSNGWLLSLPRDVHLRGGFSGSERTPDDRPAGAAPTVLRDTRPLAEISWDSPLALVDVIDGDGARMEKLQLEGFGTLLRVRGSEHVLLREVSLRDYGSIVIEDSEVRLERAHLVPGAIVLGYLRASTSSLALVDTTFENGSSVYVPGCVSATGSRVLYERVRCGGETSADDQSELLLVDSALTGSSARGAHLHAAHATLVGSQVVNTPGATEPAPVVGDSLFVWNSSFVRLRAFQRGGRSAAAVLAPRVEVVASTFFDNQCQRTNEPEPCSYDIVTEAESRVHNSLFVYTMRRDYPSDPSPRGIRGSSRTSGNCGTPLIGSFVAPDDESGQVLALQHPCADRGDAAQLEAARQRLFERVAPFLVAPFEVDLSRYTSPDWWRGETVSSEPCSTDTGEPDPGRHFPRSRCQAGAE